MKKYEFFCQTSGCKLFEAKFEIDITETTITCGACKKQITNLKEVK
jgi:hypothetical protein